MKKYLISIILLFACTKQVPKYVSAYANSNLQIQASIMYTCNDSPRYKGQVQFRNVEPTDSIYMVFIFENTVVYQPFESKNGRQQFTIGRAGLPCGIGGLYVSKSKKGKNPISYNINLPCDSCNF